MKLTCRGMTVFLILTALFISCAQAEQVLRLPAAVEIIDEEAFFGDTSLAKAVLPDGVKEIRARAFAGSSLSEINLPASLQFIDSAAFDGPEKVRVSVSPDTYAYQWAIDNGYISAYPESQHPYGNNADQEWTYTHPIDAVCLKVTFSEDTAFEDEYDTLTVTDSDGSATVYTGTQLAGETLFLPGGSFTLRLETDAFSARYGFRITSIETLDYVPVTGVTMTPAFLLMRPDETYTLTAAVLPASAPNQNIIWSSSDTSVVTVSNSGEVTAKSLGTATITAASEEDGSKFATCMVIVSLYPECQHPYGNDADQEWTYTHPTGAVCLQVTFSDDTAFENKYDTLTVTDSEGGATVYSGTQLAGETLFLPGSSFTLRLRTDGSGTRYGFRITSIETLDRVPVTGVTLTPDFLQMRPDETYTLTAAVLPASADNQNIVWSSSDTSVVTVSNSGEVSAKSLGTATITAASEEDSSKFAACTVIVSPYPECQHPYGNDVDQEWTYTHSTSAACLQVTFSDDTAFENKYDTLTITDGEGIEAVYTGTELAGETLLLPGSSFTLRLQTDSFGTRYGFRITSIEALDHIPVTGVTVTPMFLAMRVGETHTLTAAVQPASAANQNIIWSSSDASVATVSNSGVVAAKSLGTATITAASVEDGSKFAACTVSVGTSTYRALVIGNNDYGGDSQLDGCVNDMNTMAGMLTGLNNAFQVTTLPNATASEILNAIPTAFAGATNEDVSLIHYSGHGLNSANSARMGAWVGVDDKTVTFSELAAALDKVPGQIIVVMDSCHSGAAISDKGSKAADDMLEAYIQSLVNELAGRTIVTRDAKSSELAKPKYIVMAAAMYSESSYDGKPDGSNPGGYFTYNLTRGLGCTYPNGAYSGSMPADTNSDLLITLYEAFKYAYDNALNMVEQHAVYYGDGSTILFRRK